MPPIRVGWGIDFTTPPKVQDKPVSLNDIAKACGVSKMSVSRALRHQPKVREEIAEQIRAKAAELGYQSDPWVSQAMSATRLAHAPEYRETVGFIWTGKVRYVSQEYEGVVAQARNFHFKVDVFDPRADGLSSRRMDQMLQARGIRGIILSPNADRLYPHYWLPWKKYACVVLGSSLRNRGLFRVQHDHYRGSIEIMKAVRHQGYKRPGIIVSTSFHERTLRCYSAAVAAFSENLQQADGSFFPLDNLDGDAGAMLEWYRAYQPDVLLVEGVRTAHFLENAGLKSPEIAPMVITAINDSLGKWAGILQKSHRIGEEAMNALAWKLQNQEMGTMEDPPILSIAGNWYPGRSLPTAVSKRDKGT